MYGTVLIHHGIKGQKWGDRNGPPYPLGPSEHSAAEKKAGGLTGDKKKDKKILKEAARSAKYADAAAKYSKKEAEDSAKKYNKSKEKDPTSVKNDIKKDIMDDDAKTSKNLEKAAKQEAEHYKKLATDYANRYGNSKVANLDTSAGSTAKARSYIVHKSRSNAVVAELLGGYIGYAYAVDKNMSTYDNYRQTVGGSTRSVKKWNYIPY